MLARPLLLAAHFLPRGAITQSVSINPPSLLHTNDILIATGPIRSRWSGPTDLFDRQGIRT